MLLVTAWIVASSAALAPPALGATAGSWPGYMFDRNHSGFNKSETTITAANAPSMAVAWSTSEGSRMFAQPVVGNGFVYWGTFDGYEHASNPADGTPAWST